MSLDSRWLVLVRDTTSKNPDKWVTLSELDSYLNEDETGRIIRIEEKVFPKPEPDGSSLQERVDATDATLSSPLVASKMAAIDALEDEAYETQLNKRLVSPIINDTVTYATLTLDDTDDEDGILLTRKEFGGGGNGLFIKVTESAFVEAVSPVFSQTVPNVSINIYVPEAGATLNEVVTAINYVDPMVMSLITAELVSGRTGDESIALLPSGELMSGGGVDHVLTSTGTQIDAVVARAPTTGAPATAQVAAKATYDTDRITFTAKDAGADGNNITVEASCRLSATLGSGTTEITLIGEDGLYPGSQMPLVSVQVVQAATEASLLVSNTAGTITVRLPAGANNAPIDTNMGSVVAAIQEQMLPTGVLNGVIASITKGTSYDAEATCVDGAAIPFTAASSAVEEYDDAVLILLAHDGTNFDNWDKVVTEVNDHENSTLVTASAGAEDFAEPFEAMSLTGGVDITAGAPGAIRYEADKIWISVDESTTSVSNWAYALLTNPNV